MSTQLDLRQGGEPGLWGWIRANLFEIIALVVMIAGVLLEIFVSLSIITNPWSAILWLTFLFRLFPLLISDIGVGMLILAGLNFSSRPPANRIILFLLVSVALGSGDLTVLGLLGVVPANYSAIDVVIIAGVIGPIIGIMAVSSPPSRPVVGSRKLFTQPIRPC